MDTTSTQAVSPVIAFAKAGPMPLLATAKDWARRIKCDVLTVYFAARDPETPLLVRLLAIAVAAYALQRPGSIGWHEFAATQAFHQTL